MDRTTALDTIKKQLSCKKYLEKSKNGLYCCPYCGSGHGKNKTGAVKVHDTNTFTCFSCKKSGDVLDLVQEKYHIDYNDSLSMAASELGIAIDAYKSADYAKSDWQEYKEQKSKEAATSRNEVETKPKEEPKQIDHTAYYDRCKAALHGSQAVSYLAARGISEETAAAYNLGFDPNCDISGRGYLEPRIIVPLNKTCYVGRSIDPNSKYQKPFNKGGKITPFNIAALYAGNKSVFIVEGWADAISIEICGGNAVALNSTTQADNFIKLLEQSPTAATLIIAMDKDEAGKKAAAVLQEGFTRLNLPYTTANITGNYNDANEALTSDREAFKQMIEAAQTAAAVTSEGGNDYLTDFFEKIQTEAYKPYRTGLNFFDDLLGGGVVQQSLLLLMAAPGVGKSALCQQLGEAMAANKKPIVYLNLEMSREQMFARVISARMARKGKPKTALEILQGYNWSAEDKQEITNVMNEYRQNVYPYIQYNPGEIGSDLDSILGYLNEIGAAAKEKGEQAPAVIVDYLHLISSRRGLDIQELIKQAVTGLKNYAKNYDTFVIGIVATNRASNNGQITMDSGRDSSNIEYTGDYILSLNYFDIDNGKVKASDVEEVSKLQQQQYRQMIIRVLKGRFVAPGRSANLYFNAANNIFYGEHEFLPVYDEKIVPFAKPQAETPRAGKRR